MLVLPVGKLPVEQFGLGTKNMENCVIRQQQVYYLISDSSKPTCGREPIWAVTKCNRNFGYSAVTKDPEKCFNKYQVRPNKCFNLARRHTGSKHLGDTNKVETSHRIEAFVWSYINIEPIFWTIINHQIPEILVTFRHTPLIPLVLCPLVQISYCSGLWVNSRLRRARQRGEIRYMRQWRGGGHVVQKRCKSPHKNLLTVKT